MQNPWNPDLYRDQHRFVWELGADLVDQLAPQPGEQILDLGCGTGELTQQIAARGAIVQGCDADAAMVEQAQRQFPTLQFAVADARSFALDAPVDAVFSNAVLHWVRPPTTAIERISAALKPGGRAVLEFGGKGNMAQVLAAIAASREHLGLGPGPGTPWYFPSVGEYASLLEDQGLEVQSARLYDRPTPLHGEQGLRHWLQMFASRFWADLTPEQTAALLTQIELFAKPQRDDDGQWWADYRRLQVLAIKPA